RPPSSPALNVRNHSQSRFLPISDSSASVAVYAMKTSQLLLENAAYFVPMDLWVVSQVVIRQHRRLPKFLYN
ncbi:MAG: hypothetical protein ACPGCN_07755, partial [bacterium]